MSQNLQELKKQFSNFPINLNIASNQKWGRNIATQNKYGWITRFKIFSLKILCIVAGSFFSYKLHLWHLWQVISIDMFPKPVLVYFFLIILTENPTHQAMGECITVEQIKQQIAEIERTGNYNRNKFCRGTANGFSDSPGNYLNMYTRYKNCEVVIGNLEIAIDCPYQDYSFLANITEVKGFALSQC